MTETLRIAQAAIECVKSGRTDEALLHLGMLESKLEKAVPGEMYKQLGAKLADFLPKDNACKYVPLAGVQQPVSNRLYAEAEAYGRKINKPVAYVLNQVKQEIHDAG